MWLLENIIILLVRRIFVYMIVLGKLFDCVLVVVIMLGSIRVMLMF